MVASVGNQSLLSRQNLAARLDNVGNCGDLPKPNRMIVGLL